MAERPYRVTVRFNKSELQRLDSICELYDCTRTDFFRAVIEIPIVARSIDNENGVGLLVVCPKDVRELSRQVNKIGVNYNQAVKSINFIAERQFLREREMQDELNNIYEILEGIQGSIQAVENLTRLLFETIKKHRAMYLDRW